MSYVKDIAKFVENKTVFCGIDVHLNHWDLCFASDGMAIDRVKLPSDFNVLSSYLSRNYFTSGSLKFVYEAGFSGFTLQRQLESIGHSCIITPPNRMPVFQDKVKTDKRDALKLAQYLSAGLLKEVYVPPASVESDRQVNRLRLDYQKKLTRVKCQIKSHLYLHGITKPSELGNYWTKKYVHWLEELSFDYPGLRTVLDSYLAEYYFYRSKIASLTSIIRRLSKTEAYKRSFDNLTSCKGIGLITAMTILLELVDVCRFPGEKQFGSYLGLTPSQHSSGAHIRMGHITREGNSHLRRVLIEASWTVIRHDPFLRDKYERIRAKHKNGKKAIVAVARSLAVRLRKCLIEDMAYKVGSC